MSKIDEIAYEQRQLLLPDSKMQEETRSGVAGVFQEMEYLIQQLICFHQEGDEGTFFMDFGAAEGWLARVLLKIIPTLETYMIDSITANTKKANNFDKTLGICTLGDIYQHTNKEFGDRVHYDLGTDIFDLITKDHSKLQFFFQNNPTRRFFLFCNAAGNFVPSKDIHNNFYGIEELCDFAFVNDLCQDVFENRGLAGIGIMIHFYLKIIQQYRIKHARFAICVFNRYIPYILNYLEKKNVLYDSPIKARASANETDTSLIVIKNFQ